ncbi:hypothetical protein LSH36_282g02013 [Paralvinella palmiformis]|uniref:Methyltransferase FkbM domain-containing protein n=1 Tax=Paralvinella palmiformis TaxID=53620 RepID=A0AAD9JJI9_9ANNE|nr:hypothetical protein LSH36_282g02013 [Paralvinella palmiformis]
MRNICCCFMLCTRSPNKRSTVLLLSLALMLVYILTYDVIYPFDYRSSPGIGQYLEEMTKDVHSDDRNQKCSNSCSQCTFYPVSGIAKDIGFPCVQTSTRPSTMVCIFDEWSDMYISHDILYTGIWEPKVVKDFQEVLSKTHGSGVVDLGANIGFYTLIASKMGHKVIAVEPHRESIYRLHRALYIEGLGDNVYVLENGISDKRGDAVLRLSGNNQGDHRIRENPRPCSGKHCLPVIRTILLDDLCTVIGGNFSSVILKMDIQGYEHRAFRHAAVLFGSYNIDYIFMEWFLMAGHYVNSSHMSEDKILVQQMLAFLFGHDFRPYSLTADGGGPLDPAKWHLWPFDIIWIRLPDDVEKTTILSSHFRNWPP